MVITRTVEMHAQLVGYDFKKKGLPTDKNMEVGSSSVFSSTNMRCVGRPDASKSVAAPAK